MPEDSRDNVDFTISIPAEEFQDFDEFFGKDEDNVEMFVPDIVSGLKFMLAEKRFGELFGEVPEWAYSGKSERWSTFKFTIYWFFFGGRGKLLKQEKTFVQGFDEGWLACMKTFKIENEIAEARIIKEETK